MYNKQTNKFFFQHLVSLINFMMAGSCKCGVAKAASTRQTRGRIVGKEAFFYNDQIIITESCIFIKVNKIFPLKPKIQRTKGGLFPVKAIQNIL